MRAVLLAGLFGSLACSALAGPDVLGAQASTTQTSQEIEDLGRIEAMEGDEIGGKPKFRTSVQIRSEFSTNGILTGNHGHGDLIFFPQIEVGFNAPLKHNFSFDVAARVESGIYTQEQDRGFIGYSIISTLDWRPKVNWPRVYVGAEPYRYDSFDTGDKITQAIGLTTGTDWGIAFNKGYSLAFVGYSFSNYISDPSIDDRSTNRFIAGITHQFSARLFSTLFYQFAYSDYDNVDRTDYRHLVGGNLTYQIRSNLFGSVILTFVDNDSSQEFASYQTLNLSVGVNMQF